MRAFVVTGPGRAEVRDVEAPAARPGEVVVDVARAGVCGTDMEFFSGAMSYLHTGQAQYPVRIGHEWSGTVSAVGAGVDRAWLGRRVTGDTMLGCGRCARCTSGRQHVCADRYEIGIRNGWPGALAEQLPVPVRALQVLPDQVDAALGALVEPGGNALRAVCGAALPPGGRLLVLGPGTIGLLIAQVAAAHGAEVHLLGHSPESLEFAATVGFPRAWTTATLPDLAWDAVIDPFWTRMCAVLEDDVSYRVAAQMNGGLYALLEDLHPEVSLEGNLLRVDKPQHTSATYEAHAMTLTPSVFAWPGLILDDGQGDRFGLTYAARGVARVWEGLTAMDRIDDEPLAALLGRTRAAILEMTAVPLSTTQIALLTYGEAPGTGKLSAIKGLQPHRIAHVTANDCSGISAECVVDHTHLPALDEPCHQTGTITHEQFVGSNGQFERAIGVEVMLHAEVGLGVVGVPVQWISVPLRDETQSLGPAVSRLKADPLYGAHVELNLERMVVGTAQV